MLPRAFVTLLTDSSYLPGALVLLNALRDLHPAPRDFKIVCLITPETVDARAIGILQNAGFDIVIGVEPIASGKADYPGLELMGRTDLNLALTKLHVFRLGSMFSKIIYLDADTLPIKPLSHLFESTMPHTLSACPDIGWPDCFNSGVMVIEPREADFEGLQKVLQTENGQGSFDGADQGLLNQYFSEDGPGEPWNRLPFTYNVTPSAAYQYAPAYRHYADKISVLHFIGSKKPWNHLATRPAGATSRHARPFDYDALLDLWFDVYDRFVRPTAALQPEITKRFEVPEHISIWNQPDGNITADERMSLEDLKKAVIAGVTSQKQDRYISMPLEGRVDLLMPKADTTAAPAAVDDGLTDNAGHDSTSAKEGLSSEPPSRAERQQSPSEEERTERPESTPFGGAAWNAAHHPPPKNSRPEMVVPMTTVYAPAWDEPPSSSATYFEEMVDTALNYPTLPESVRTNDWYGDFATSKPDPQLVSNLFPWEGEGKPRPAVSRRFPKEPPAAVAASSEDENAPTTASGMDGKDDNFGRSSHNDDQQLPNFAASSVSTSSISRPTLNFAESMASYTNAWDEVASIHSYARRLTALGIGVERRSQADGLETAVATPRGSSTPNLPYRDTSAVCSPSSSSADGDDEDDTDDGHVAHVNRRRSPSYRDREAQTERLGVDAMVQATPEPTADTPSIISLVEGEKTLPPAMPSTNAGTAAVEGRPSHSRQQSSRTWDPNTDIELRRQDSEEVLHRFMKGSALNAKD